VRNTAAPLAPLQVLPANVLPEMSPCTAPQPTSGALKKMNTICAPAGQARQRAACGRLQQAAPWPPAASRPAGGAQGRPGRARAARLHVRVVDGAAVLARGVVAEDAAGQAAVAGAAEHGAAAGGRVQVELAVMHVARRALRERAAGVSAEAPRPAAVGAAPMQPSVAAVWPRAQPDAMAHQEQSTAHGCSLAPAARATTLAARASPGAGTRRACGVRQGRLRQGRPRRRAGGACLHVDGGALVAAAPAEGAEADVSAALVQLDAGAALRGAPPQVSSRARRAGGSRRHKIGAWARISLPGHAASAHMTGRYSLQRCAACGGNSGGRSQRSQHSHGILYGGDRRRGRREHELAPAQAAAAIRAPLAAQSRDLCQRGSTQAGRAGRGSSRAPRLQRGVVVEAAAAVHDARAVVLPHARAVQRLVVPEV